MGASTIVEWRKELGERFRESYKNVPFSRFFEKTRNNCLKVIYQLSFKPNFFEISFQ